MAYEQSRAGKGTTANVILSLGFESKWRMWFSVNKSKGGSVAIFGDLLDFGQFFKAFGNN